VNRWLQSMLFDFLVDGIVLIKLLD